MRSNESPIVGVRLTEKNRFYLARLGYIDNRSGKKKSLALNTSDFVNRCITLVLENSKGLANAEADPEELRRAYYKFLIAENTKEIDRREEQNRKLASQMKTETLELKTYDLEVRHYGASGRL